MRTALSTLLFLLPVALGAAKASAQTSVTDGVLINADNMFRDVVSKQLKLSGNVQVVFKGQHLSCDKALVDLKKEQITAEGHVILSNERVHVEGDRIVFNYKTNTGYIYNGFVQSGQVVFQGDVVEKTGEDHYLASNATYTACETCPPGWSFSGRKIDAEIGGYARIQRPVFRVGGVPILILPSLIVPLKSARQSGLLVPSMDFSKKGGVALSAIYFWAINRSQDVTLTAKWYKLRGFKAIEDYRYVLAKDSYGHLQSAWMSDRGLQNDLHATHSIDRWFVNYDHIYDLPEDYVQRADLRLISDLRYARDFPEEVVGHGDPALENKASITKLTDNNYASAEVDVYTNLLRADPFAHNESAVHRFPELRYSLKDQELGETGALVAMNLDYVNFARAGYNYDDLRKCDDATDTTVDRPKCYAAYARVPYGYDKFTGDTPKSVMARDGRMDRGADNTFLDLFRTGERLDIQPTVSYPFHLAHKFDFLPSVTYRETQYRFDPPATAELGAGNEPGFNRTAARRYVQTDLLAKTEFTGIFGDQNNPKSDRWKHSLEPQLGYSQIPWMRKPDHPFFGDYKGLQNSRQFEPISDSDLGNPRTGVQFDYNDRTYEKRVVNFALNNRLTKKTWLNSSPDYRTAILFNISQAYDFKEAARQDSPPHPWTSIDSLLNVRFEHFETYTTASYNGYANKTNTSSRVRVSATTKTFGEVSYTQNFLLNDDYTLTANGETRNIGIGGGFITQYFEAAGEVAISDITHKIQSWSYGLNIRPPGNCWVIRVDHRQVLGGDAQIRASLNFDFGGETGAKKM